MDAVVHHDCISLFFAHDVLNSQQVSVGCRGRKRRLRAISLVAVGVEDVEGDVGGRTLRLELGRNCRRVLLLNENDEGLNVCSVEFC